MKQAQRLCQKKYFEVQKYVISMFLSSLLAAYFHIILPSKHTRRLNFQATSFSEFPGEHATLDPHRLKPPWRLLGLSPHWITPSPQKNMPSDLMGMAKKKNHVEEIQLTLDAVSQCERSAYQYVVPKNLHVHHKGVCWKFKGFGGPQKAIIFKGKFEPKLELP